MKTCKEQYGKRMRFVIAQLSVLFLLPFAAAAAAPTLTTYYWASNETSLVSGAFNDSANWLDSSFQPAASVPGELSLASFYHLPKAEYTVCLPEGVYTNYASLQIYGRQGKAVTIDGRGSVFVSPTTATDNYSGARVSFYTSVNAAADDKKGKFLVDDGDAGDYTSGYCLSNVVWRFVPRYNSNASIEAIEFRQGLFNFYDYDGMPHRFRSYLYSSTPDDGTQPILIAFEKGSSLRIHDFYPVWQYSRGKTLVNFNGGEHHIFGTFHIFHDKFEGVKADQPVAAEVHVGGDAVVNANVFKVCHGTATQRYGENQHTLVAIENGGTMTATGGVRWATFNAQSLYVTNGAWCVFGPTDGSAVRPVNNFANAAIQSGIGTNIVAALVDNARLDMTGDNRIGNVDLSLNDSTLNLTGFAGIGNDSGRSARIAATNSTIALDLDSGAILRVGYSGTGVVELVDSDMTFAAKRTMHLGENLGSFGDFTLDGGSFASGRSEQNGNEVMIGCKGTGKLTVKGGSFEAYAMYVHYENSGTSNPTCVVHQTGGTIKITGGSFANSENEWYSCRFGQNSSTGVSKLVLDGGEFHTARLYANYSALNSPSTGCHAFFEADGGTIVGLTPSDSAARVITLRNFEKASLGSKGLTIRTSGETRTAQDFCDKEGCDGSGRLVLDGSGVKKLYGTNSTESVLMCAGGKTLFVPNADTGANASHYSNVIVTNGATLSLAGAQTSATFRSLRLADGARLELEKTDCIVCDDGMVVVGNNVALDIVDSAVTGTYPLVVCDGEASESDMLNWRRATVTIAGRADHGITPCATYDDQTGKTTFALEITDGGPLAGNVTWDGSWNATGADRVTFAGGGTAAVAVDSNVTVGALEFDSSVDYTLSGAGTLEFSDRGGYARVDVASGEQTISANVVAPQDLTLESASGAKLTVDGEIVVGGVIKEGRGTVTLENPANDLSGGVTVKEGLLSVPTPEALGKGPISLEGGTLEIADEGGVVRARSVSLATEYATTAAVVKVEADVTMPAPSATRGAFIKRGAGRLTLTSDKSVTLCGQNSGTLQGTNNGRVRSTTTFDEQGGYSVNGEYAFGGFNVAEGELVLRGTADDVIFAVPAYTCVGIGSSPGTASPGLVVDHATFNCSGSRFTFANTYTSSFAVAPYIVATNKSTLVGSFTCGWDASTSGMSASVLLDDSVQFSNYMFYPMRSGRRADYVYRNGSALYVNCGSQDMQARSLDYLVFDYGPSTLIFSNSVLARKTALSSDTTLPMTIFGKSANFKHDIYMRDGSTLYSNWVTNQYTSATSLLTVGFDNSEWKPIRSDETGDFTFDFPPYETVRFEMEGRGVILSPSEGNTFTLVSPFVGDGGMRKQGEGTIAFACKDGMKSWDFAGTMSLEEGVATLAAGAVRDGAKAEIAYGATLDLNGSTLTGAILSGSGTVSNGTLASATIRTEVADSGAVISGVALDGVAFVGSTTVDFGRSEADPLSSKTPAIALFQYSGAAPDVSGWKAMGLGEENTVGIFTAEDGVVKCRITHKGLCIIFK